MAPASRPRHVRGRTGETGGSTIARVSHRTRHGLAARDIALVATFAALIAVLGIPGQLYVLGNAVPITLQTLGVMLAGSVLGWRRGALATLVVIVLAAAGLPVLAGGRGGLAVFAGPTVGYLLAWPIGAAVTGWLVERRLPRYSPVTGFVANLVGGVAVVYAVGVPVQAAVTGTSNLLAVAVASLVFLPGDLLKALVATTVAAGIHRGYPAVAPRRELAARR